MYRNTVIFIHVASSSAFLGAILSALLVKIGTEKSAVGNIAPVLGALMYLEKVLTGPAAILITVTGVVLVYQNGAGLLWSFWLQMILILWICSAVIARMVLVPSLRNLHCVASNGGAYAEKARKWNRTSAALLVAQVTVLALAVFKPTF